MSEPAWLTEAMAHLGLKEVTGKKDNPAIMQFYADCGHPEVEHDETAWCAAFVGACLKRSGKPTSAPQPTNLMARSYLKYGTPTEPVPGAIAIWPRGKPPSGHVGLVVEVNPDTGTIKTIEGNASNQVKYARHKISEALAYRWPPEAKQPVIEPEPATASKAVAVAAQSKTVWMQLAAPVLVIWGYAEDGTRWLFETILSFVATLPGLGNDIEASLGTAQQFSTWLGLPFAQISLGVVVAFCAFSIYRHVRDKLNGGAA